jgi:putative photosynthetic complex assembly protein
MTQPSTTFRRSNPDEMIPRTLLRAVVALVLASLAVVVYARVTDAPLSATPPVSQVVSERKIVLHTTDLSGAVTVLGADGTLIADLTPETGGFIAGVARVIERERTKNRMPLDGPVTVTRNAAGRLSITDPSTGWSADLMGFGADNARAFARLLDQ